MTGSEDISKFKCKYVSRVGRVTQQGLPNSGVQTKCQLVRISSKMRIPNQFEIDLCVLHTEKDEDNATVTWDVPIFNNTYNSLLASLRETDDNFLDLAGVRFPDRAETSFRVSGEEQNSIVTRYEGVLLIDCDFGSAFQISDVEAAEFSLHASGAQFHGIVRIEDSQLGSVDFTDAVIDGPEITFKDVTFQSTAVFRKTIFRGHVRFDTCTFIGGVDLFDAHFFASVCFNRCDFKCEPIHMDKEKQGAELPNNGFCVDLSTLSVESPAIVNNLSFLDCSFKGLVNFKSRVFEGETKFDESFFNDPIVLTKADMSMHTSFLGTKFKDMSKETEIHKLQDWRRTFRFLKKVAQESGDQAQWFDFSITEQSASLFQHTWFHPNRLVWTLYGWTADYGRSWLRPLVLLLSLFVVFCSLYCLFDLQMLEVQDKKVSEYIWSKVGFTVAQTVRPFDALQSELLKENSGIVTFGAFIQSCLSLVLIGTFALAVRNQFVSYK